MPFGAKMSQEVFQLRMDAILEQCPGVIGIHDDMVIFGVDQEDHDTNLINLLNICQKEGLVLNSKKLELRRERVTFFGAEYSASRPQEGPRDHRDDSAQGQTTTSVFSRYGQLHGDIHSKPLTSRVSLGRSTNTVLSASQDLNCQGKHHTVEILRQEPASNNSSGRFSQRAGSLSHTEAQRKGPADRLCQQEPHGHGDEVCQHRTGTSSHCLCLPKV